MLDVRGLMLDGRGFMLDGHFGATTATTLLTAYMSTVYPGNVPSQPARCRGGPNILVFTKVTCHHSSPPLSCRKGPNISVIARATYLAAAGMPRGTGHFSNYADSVSSQLTTAEMPRGTNIVFCDDTAGNMSSQLAAVSGTHEGPRLRTGSAAKCDAHTVGVLW